MTKILDADAVEEQKVPTYYRIQHKWETLKILLVVIVELIREDKLS